MPPGEWSWLEAYGPLEADAEAVHGRDWRAAGEEVERALERLVGRADVDREFARAGAWADAPPTRSSGAARGGGRSSASGARLRASRRVTSRQCPSTTRALQKASSA